MAKVNIMQGDMLEKKLRDCQTIVIDIMIVIIKSFTVLQVELATGLNNVWLIDIGNWT